MSQLEDIGKNIQTIFNTTLRGVLKYIDNFTYSLNLNDYSITLKDYEREHELYDILKSNPKLLENVRNNIKVGLKNKYQEIQDVELTLSDDKSIKRRN